MAIQILTSTANEVVIGNQNPILTISNASIGFRNVRTIYNIPIQYSPLNYKWNRTSSIWILQS